MPADSVLRIIDVFPDLLGLYGDGGNALALRHLAGLHGLEVEVHQSPAGEPIPLHGDIYLLAGAEDAAQRLARELLAAQPAFGDLLRDGRPCLAVCAGFQLLSRSFEIAEGRLAGLGVLDVTCDRLPGPRAVGEIVTEAVGLPVGTLTGFENHQGGAVLGPEAAPLGRVVAGIGNGPSRVEGALQHAVVATYLHGPVLVRNPALAAHLLGRATGRDLPPVAQPIVEQLRRERIDAALAGKG